MLADNNWGQLLLNKPKLQHRDFNTILNVLWTNKKTTPLLGQYPESPDTHNHRHSHAYRLILDRKHYWWGITDQWKQAMRKVSTTIYSGSSSENHFEKTLLLQWPGEMWIFTQARKERERKTREVQQKWGKQRGERERSLPQTMEEGSCRMGLQLGGKRRVPISGISRQWEQPTSLFYQKKRPLPPLFLSAAVRLSCGMECVSLWMRHCVTGYTTVVMPQAWSQVCGSRMQTNIFI